MTGTDEAEAAATAADDALYVLTAMLLTPAQFPSVLGDDYPEACAALGLGPYAQGYGLVLGQDGAGARWTVVIDDVSLVAVAIASWDCGMEYDLSPDERTVVAALPGWPVELAVAAPDVPAPHDPAPDPGDPPPLTPPDTSTWGPAQRRLGADMIALQWTSWREQLSDDAFLPEADAGKPDAAERPEAAGGFGGSGEAGGPGSSGGSGDAVGSRGSGGPGESAGPRGAGGPEGMKASDGSEGVQAPEGSQGPQGSEVPEDSKGSQVSAESAGFKAPEGSSDPARGNKPAGSEGPAASGAGSDAEDDDGVRGEEAAVGTRASGVQRVLEEVGGYLESPPPVGRVRSAFAPGGARTLRADGPGWSLVARTDDMAFVLFDDDPGEVHPVGRGSRLPALLEALDAMAVRPS
ncbi:hypothetical protein [Streptomyces sp. NPDC051994]|uniref:hypothetical protein n=1 Tax=unclassified Streptomyces TaxID=2593676 RepID=UPI00341AF49C